MSKHDRTITEFFNKEFTDYSSYDNYRKIASYIDGQKVTARKILHTVLKNNIKNPIKSSILCSKMIEECAYLHGESSGSQVIVGLAQDFTGSNNLPLLKREGSFGSRAIQVAAAPRYIFTCKEDYLDDIFKKDDIPLLIEQELEGDKIEPRFFAPIIPLLLINGNEAVSVGFAQKILPRNIKDIIRYLNMRLNGYKVDKLKIIPWFKGFKGEVKEYDKNSFEIRGKFERIDKNTIKIIEIPTSYDLRGYLDVLDDLEEKNLIQSYRDFSTDTSFEFEVKLSPDFKKLDDNELLDKLKLIKRVVENYVCNDENNKIIEFSNIKDILDRYYDIRLDLYKKRKEYLVNKLKNDLRISISKYLFIQGILNETIVIKYKTIEQIEKILEKVEKIIKVEGKYDYLLNMRIATMSKDKLEELKNEVKNLEIELKKISSMKPEELWQEDLKKLKI